MKKTSYNLVQESMKIRNTESSEHFRERWTSSSSSSSINDSLKSFSPDPSLNHDEDDDDDVSSKDESNHQWNLDQILSTLPIRQLSN